MIVYVSVIGLLELLWILEGDELEDDILVLLDEVEESILELDWLILGTLLELDTLLLISPFLQAA